MVQRLRYHLRLLVAVSFGSLTILALGQLTSLHAATVFLIGWNAMAWLYIPTTIFLMLRSSHSTMRLRAKQYDEGSWFMLLIVVLAATASLSSIVAELVHVKDLEDHARYTHIFLALITIVSSWLFTHLCFALHYAHRYYSDATYSKSNEDVYLGGLIFPGEGLPDYADFLYMAAIVGTSAQTADVLFSSKSMRRVALTHCLIAFAFNTIVPALTINIAADLL